MAREKDLDNKVLAYLEARGAWSVKYWAGAKYTKKGIPDILACIDGYFFGIEDKREDGKPTLLQLKNLEWIRDAGGYGILLYPTDFENFKNFLGVRFLPQNLSRQQMQWYVANIELQKEWYDKLNKI